ncbi:RnfH family protein|uniref:RnfH family protein n=1 Tax=Noviherbaspirillum sp. L7-7A TaxID=2850560 RepID=UPI001C2BF5F8|nr:RnfH family protein [Noviherbaspirillum sp. L7-7A]MBV0878762.1 RnfH family protein [Noviherbaspirillum sp. L7-7A]
MADIRVQVCHPLPHEARLRELVLAEGSTVRDAVTASGLLPRFNPDDCPVGIFGKKKTPDTVLRDGDRVEIYRPLVADPKDARRRRAVKKDRAG